MIVNILVPKDGKWKVNGIHRASAATVLALTKSILRKATAKEKTCVRVKNGNMYVNETLPSKDAEYLMYCTTCFLDDFLNEKTMKKIERKYK